MYPLRLRPMVWTLSATVDLVGVTDPLHGRRVAYYALEIAKHLDFIAPWTMDDITKAALLHDCGVSSTEIHERLLREMEWSCAMSHCEKGAELLSQNPFLSHLAEAVRMHHRRWDKVDPFDGCTADEWLGNLIFLADRLDVMIANQVEEILFSQHKIYQRIQSLSPSLFNPDFVKALGKCVNIDAFWLVREEHALKRYFQDWLDEDQHRRASDSEVEGIFDLFGQCVDAKSHFTAEHSRAVGLLSEQIGIWMGLDPQRCFRLKLAGFVHDIGKLRVPDSILAKPGALDPVEFSVIRHHSFDAYEILGHLEGYEDVARWASLHHERMDGSGYPYHLSGEDVPLEARILAYADIFQAMAQNRPYRRGLDAPRILQMLKEMVEMGQLDAQIYEIIENHQQECVSIAHMRDFSVAR